MQLGPRSTSLSLHFSASGRLAISSTTSTRRTSEHCLGTVIAANLSLFPLLNLVSFTTLSTLSLLSLQLQRLTEARRLIEAAIINGKIKEHVLHYLYVAIIHYVIIFYSLITTYIRRPCSRSYNCLASREIPYFWKHKLYITLITQATKKPNLSQLCPHYRMHFNIILPYTGTAESVAYSGEATDCTTSVPFR